MELLLVALPIQSVNIQEHLDLINIEPRIIGIHPETNKEINLLIGRYGPYLEVQADDPDKKPKRSTIPKTIDPDEVNLELAINLLSLPKIIGIHPEDGNEIKWAWEGSVPMLFMRVYLRA